MGYIILVIFLFAWLIGATIGIACEKKGFNNGICPHCNQQLILYDTDSQDGRSYCCNCGYHTWVSYNCVDNKFIEKYVKISRSENSKSYD